MERACLFAFYRCTENQALRSALTAIGQQAIALTAAVAGVLMVGGLLFCAVTDRPSSGGITFHTRPFHHQLRQLQAAVADDERRQGVKGGPDDRQAS